jgi:hypothetical protein
MTRTTQVQPEIATSNPADADPHPASADDAGWRTLYRIGAVCASLVAIFIPLQIAAYLVWPPPATVIGRFTQLQDSAMIGLVGLDLILVIDGVLGVIISLALYVALRRVDPSLMLVGTACGLMATAAYFASNTCINMLQLSHQYAAATSDIQRQMLEAAGEVTMAIYSGTAFHLYYILGAVGITLVSYVMLRTPTFGKWLGWTGIISGIVSLGLYLPGYGVYVSILSVVALWIWYILIARKLFRLA